MKLESERLLLALDASTALGTVAIGTSRGIVVESALNVQGGHSAAFLPVLDHALHSAGLTPGDLHGVVIGSGPGSFTGVRVAAALAKGIVMALEVPLFAFSSLLAAAAQAAAAAGPVCALFDARGRDVYGAVYRFAPMLEVVHPPAALAIDAVVERHKHSEVPFFLGDGAVRHRLELIDRLGARVAAPHFGSPSAAALIWLGLTLPGIGLVAEPGSWEPEYLRPSGAERIAASRAGGTNQ